MRSERVLWELGDGTGEKKSSLDLVVLSCNAPMQCLIPYNNLMVQSHPHLFAPASLPKPPLVFFEHILFIWNI